MFMLLVSVALAQSAAPSVQAKPSLLETIFPFLAILVVFYFVFSRPQQKKMKEHQDLLATLKRGDKVITNSGIFGEITGVTDKFVTLEVSENVRIRILKSQIAGQANELAM